VLSDLRKPGFDVVLLDTPVAAAKEGAPTVAALVHAVRWMFTRGVPSQLQCFRFSDPAGRHGSVPIVAMVDSCSVHASPSSSSAATVVLNMPPVIKQTCSYLVVKPTNVTVIREAVLWCLKQVITVNGPLSDAPPPDLELSASAVGGPPVERIVKKIRPTKALVRHEYVTVAPRPEVGPPTQITGFRSLVAPTPTVTSRG
jgi:hypothetical protein